MMTDGDSCSGTAAAEKPSSHPLLRPALFSMITAQALVVFASLAVPIMAPQIAHANGVEVGLIGAYSSVMFLAAIMAVLITPSLVDRLGSVRVSQGTLCLGASGLALAFESGLWGLAGSAFLIGLAYGPANPASSAVLRRVTTSGNRARIFSLKQTSVPIGGTAAGLAVPWLNGAGGWAAVLLAGMLLLGVGALVLQRWRQELDSTPLEQSPHPRPVQLLAPLRFVMGRADLRLLAMMSCAFAAVQFTFLAVCVVVLVAHGGLSLPLAGAALSAAMATGFAMRILAGYVADLVGGSAMLGLFALLMSMGTFGLAAMTPNWPTWVSLATALTLGASALSWNGVYLSEVATRSNDHDVALATSGCMVMTFLGGMIGPASFSLITLAAGSSRLALVVIGLLGAGAMAAVIVLRYGDRRRPS